MRFYSLLFFVIVPFCVASSISVDDDGPADFSTIQEAINNSNSGDVIEVQPGLYTGFGNRDVDFAGRAITVRSQNGPGDCIIDCQSDPDNLHRGFCFTTNEGADSVLDGFTIINGQQEYGGAILCDGSSPIIKNCVFNDNLGRVFTLHTFPDQNSIPLPSGGGGAICIQSGSVAKVINCSFNNNSAFLGGNSIYCRESAPVIEKCTFTNNHGALRGGAIYLFRSDTSIINCLLTNNSSVEYGGAISCKGDYHTPSIINCTLSENASERGGALDIITTNVTITNCIFWANSPTEITNTSTGTGNVTNSNIQNGWPGQGNIDIDPLFKGLGDYHLVFGSPCVDSGTSDPPGEIPADDIEGNDRPLNGDDNPIATIDMGAYEYIFTPESPVMAVAPGTIHLTSPIDGPEPPRQFLYIFNAGSGEMNWQITGAPSWLNIEPDKGTSTGEVDDVNLTVDPDGLVSDMYKCVITVVDTSDATQVRNIPVEFRLDPELHVPSEYNTIQAAIDAAFDGDEIIVSNGTYTGDGNCDIDFKGKAITVRSEDNNPSMCIIDCQGSSEENHRGFYFHTGESEDSVLSGFTIKNGFVTSPGFIFEGGGILCSNQHTNPTIKNCIVINNTAWSGGGISCNSASPTIRNCIVANNEAYNDKAGGILCWVESSAKITGCTIVYNKAKFSGGGIYFYSGSPLLENCIVWGNRKIWDNSLNQISKASYSTLSVSYCDIQGGWDGNGNINQYPNFVDVSNLDYHLVPSSPCRDAGNPDYEPLPLEMDIDAGQRKTGIRVDIGADEVRDMLADMDEDGSVGLGDLVLLSEDWSLSYGDQDFNWSQDINKDGIINLNDFSILANIFGQKIDTESPSKPGNLSSTGISTAQNSLTWDISTDNTMLAGYRIYRNGTYLSYSPTNRFDDRNVHPGSIYIYQISACDAVYNESELSEACVVTTKASQ